eukprot:scaffold2168_cov131-Skeletonema_dohrnii-CCMP3373.AAC.5
MWQPTAELAAVPIGPHQVTYDVVATPIRRTNREIRYGCQLRSWQPSQMASSGHLRRCIDDDASEQMLEP